MKLTVLFLIYKLELWLYGVNKIYQSQGGGAFIILLHHIMSVSTIPGGRLWKRFQFKKSTEFIADMVLNKCSNGFRC